MPRLRIIVADDNPALLRELVSLLEVEFDVVATAVDGNSTLDHIRRYKPDVVVLDFHMPALNGLEIIGELMKDPPGPPVVICSVETDPELVEATRQAGAVAYIFKTQIEDDLIPAVKSAVQGKFFVSRVSH